MNLIQVVVEEMTIIMFEGCVRNSQQNPNRGYITIKSI